MNRRRRQHGFTLIELLVVIAALTLLMAILLPTLRRVKRQAQAVVCRSNQRQWGIMFSAYTSENDGRWFAWNPKTTIMLEDVVGHFGAHDHVWVVMMHPYWMDSTDVFLCPVATKPRTESWPYSLLGVSGGSTYRAWQYNFRLEPGTNGGPLRVSKKEVSRSR